MEKQKVKKFYRKTVKPALFGMVVFAGLVILGIVLQCIKGGGYYFLSVFAGMFGLILGLVFWTERSKTVEITGDTITFNDDPEINGHDSAGVTVRFDDIVRVSVVEKGFKRELEYEFLLKTGDTLTYEFEHVSQNDIETIIDAIRNRGLV